MADEESSAGRDRSHESHKVNLLNQVIFASNRSKGRLSSGHRSDKDSVSQRSQELKFGRSAGETHKRMQGHYEMAPTYEKEEGN